MRKGDSEIMSTADTARASLSSPETCGEAGLARSATGMPDSPAACGTGTVKHAAEINEKIPWQEMTVGCEIYEPGTSRLTKTGEWRSRTPVWDKDKCKQCVLCAPFCPDSCIPVSEGKRGDFDYDHCKGCGICIKACPFNAIHWEDEEERS